MHEYFLEIARLKVRIKSPLELNLSPRLSPFVCQPCEFDIDCELVENSEHISEAEQRGKMLYKDEVVAFFEYNNLIYRCFYFLNKKFCAEFDLSNPFFYKIYVDPIENGEIPSLAEIMCFDIACLHRGGIQLHASFVKTDFGAVLFSAPSGTGKSTQANLWKQHKGAKIVNGDKTILRKVDGKWIAFGSPWAGTSGIYINDFAENPAVVIIRQAPKNKIRQLSKRDAVMLLLSETKTQCWLPSEGELVCSLLEDFVISNSVFLLECRPDIEAVEIVNNFLLN